MKSKLIITAALLYITLFVPLSLFSQSRDFEMDGTTLVKYNGNAENVTISASVTTIVNYAFYSCEKLRTVTISRRTRIGALAFPSNAQITYSD